MKHSTADSSDAKKMHHDECCELYREYCYPCTIEVASTTPKAETKKSEKGRKRSA